MGASSIPVLLVTANIGSVFEDPEEMLRLWTETFLDVISQMKVKFVALHCQEIGGKNFAHSMKYMNDFVNLLTSSKELCSFDKVRIFLDENYTSQENFTGLGSFYFIHDSINSVELWNFRTLQFETIEGKEIHSGNIESVDFKEKAKFPLHFFPECKWSRKGFLRTRWSLDGSVFDLINVHLFHDASNLVAMESFPSQYCKNRRRALEYILKRFYNDSYVNVPYFLFGDFNFRTDNEGVIKKLTERSIATRLQNNKSNDHTKLQFVNEGNQTILSIGKKEFNHIEHQDIFLNCEWLKQFDKEVEAYGNNLTEFPITFGPTYPFEEDVSKAKTYLKTRCPAWCDRILFSYSAKSLIDEGVNPHYSVIGPDSYTGDHKPVYLKIALKTSAGMISNETDTVPTLSTNDNINRDFTAKSKYICIKNLDDATSVFLETSI